MFTWLAVIFTITLIAGLLMAFSVWRKWRLLDPLNPVPSSPKLFIIGLILVAIGIVGLGVVYLKPEVFKPVKEKEQPPAPKPFSILTTSPADGATVPRNAIIQIFFNRSVKPTDAFIRVTAKGGEGDTLPPPGSVVIVNEPEGGDSEAKSTMIFRTLLPCGEAVKNENCFEESKEYVVELDGKRIHTLKGDETLDCGSEGICRFSFTSGKEIDKSVPKVKFADNLLLPASKDAKVYVSSEDDAGVAYTRFTLDKMQSKSKYLGLATGALDGKIPIAVDLSDIIAPSHHFITAEVFDIAGHRQEATTVVGIYQNHCFNNEQDANEIGKDCGGPDCEACQAKKEEKK